MNYELAKELREAGFPQKGMGTFSRHRKDIDEQYVEVNEIYIPTLSELIEACGEKFIQLTRTDDGEWICAGNISEDRINIDKALRDEFEKTPEEAMARLWLALNKKYAS